MTAISENNIEELYTKYGPMVLRRCRQILKNEDAAMDALQEVFMRLIDKKDSLKDAYPSSLLYTMATNICLNMIKKDEKTAQDDNEGLIEQIAQVDDRLEKVAAEDLLDRIFSREVPSTRVMAVLHYVDGMTLEEVAGETGLSVSGVRKRLRRLKKNVRINEKELL